MLVISQISNAQNFADPDFYLIDSLDLDDLPQIDKDLLDGELKNFHNTDNDSLKLQIFEHLIEELRHNCWIKYNKLAYEFAWSKLRDPDLTPSEKYFYKSHMAGTVNNMGFAANNEGNAYMAVDYYLNAGKLFESIQDSSGMALTYINSAVAYNNVGEVELSNEMDLKGIEIGRQNGDMKVLSVGYKNLSMKHLNAQNYDAALENSFASLKYAKLLTDDPVSEGVSLMGIGQIYSSMDEDSLAATYFIKGLGIKKKYATEASYLGSLGIYGEFLRKKLFQCEKNSEEFWILKDSCLNVQTKVVERLEELKYNNSLIRTYNELSRIHSFLGSSSKAVHFADLAFELSLQTSNLPKRQKAAIVRYEALRNAGRYKEALSMLELYNELSAELNYQAATEKVLQDKYKLDYKLRMVEDSLNFEKHKAVQAKEIEHQQNQIDSDNQQKWILYSGLGLIALFSFFLFKKFKQTQHQNKLIENQKYQIIEAHLEVQSSIEYAKRLQGAILAPLADIQDAFTDSFVLFQPKDIVSGDFYWFEKKDNVIYIAAADCTGHGVPGAMVSVVCSNALHRSLAEFNLSDPADILNKTRELVIDTFAKSGENVKDGMDISLCRVDKASNELTFAGANNPLWILRKNTSEMEEVKGNKQPVGLYEGMKPFVEHHLNMMPGDEIFLFTDGYADQFGGEKGKKMKYKPFKSFLVSNSNLPLGQQMKALESNFEEWRGEHEQIDDVCIIGIKF